MDFLVDKLKLIIRREGIIKGDLEKALPPDLFSKFRVVGIGGLVSEKLLGVWPFEKARDLFGTEAYILTKFPQGGIKPVADFAGLVVTVAFLAGLNNKDGQGITKDGPPFPPEVAGSDDNGAGLEDLALS